MIGAALPAEFAAIVERSFWPLRMAGALPVDGGSQVTVWRVALAGAERRDIAVRLVRRPIVLLQRQAVALEAAYAAGAPVARILAVEALDAPGGGDSRGCLMVMEWAGGEHPAPGAHAFTVGEALARLHGSLRGHEDRFHDRPLKLDTYGGYVGQLRSAGANASGLLRAIERHQKALRTWDEYYGLQMPRQLLHGDMHQGNVVVNRGVARLIDFDKMMVGPRVFDLAKYIATSCFRARHEARLARRAVDDLLAGYASIDPLTDVEDASLIPLCMIVNAESALCGLTCGIPDLVQRAGTVGRWWSLKTGYGRLSRLRSTRRAPAPARQLALFGAA